MSNLRDKARKSEQYKKYSNEINRAAFIEGSDIASSEIDSLKSQLTEANALIAEGKSVADLQHKAIQEYKELLSDAKKVIEFYAGWWGPCQGSPIEAVNKFAQARLNESTKFAADFLKKLESKNGA